EGHDQLEVPVDALRGAPLDERRVAGDAGHRLSVDLHGEGPVPDVLGRVLPEEDERASGPRKDLEVAARAERALDERDGVDLPGVRAEGSGDEPGAAGGGFVAPEWREAAAREGRDRFEVVDAAERVPDERRNVRHSG